MATKTETALAEKVLETTLVRVHARAFGLAIGLILGLGLFLATNVLVLRGGTWVGMHLGSLSQVLPGYEVSFVGSLVGFMYAFVIGYALGRLIAPRQRIARAAARDLRSMHVALDGGTWGKALGTLSGAIPFLVTNALVYRGGVEVWPMIRNLAIYFPGYRVSFAGSIVAFLYGFALGYLAGRLIAALYNRLIPSAPA